MDELLRQLEPAAIRAIVRSALKRLESRVSRELDLPTGHADTAARLLLQVRLAYGAYGETAEEEATQMRELLSWHETLAGCLLSLSKTRGQS